MGETNGEKSKILRHRELEHRPMLWKEGGLVRLVLLEGNAQRLDVSDFW